MGKTKKIPERQWYGTISKQTGKDWGVPQAETKNAALYAAPSPAEIFAGYNPTTPVAGNNIYPTLSEVKWTLKENADIVQLGGKFDH